MLFCVELVFKVPETVPSDRIAALRAEEKERVQDYQRSGELKRVWRIAGQFASLLVFDVADNDRLHDLVSSLPLFPYMTVRVLPLARHPTALDECAGA